ncbi:MAG TPA: peptidylprolyl isomerase [Bdellovibrionota bacterium]|nr:peptidylprolyl isomerase [Bdellovibrionota bacterium]
MKPVIALTLILSLLGCKPQTPPSGKKEQQPTATEQGTQGETISEAAGSGPVAVIGSNPISPDLYKELFEKFNLSRPFGQLTREQFLQELVRIELGALEAGQEKYDQKPDVQFQMKAALSQAFMREKLGSKVEKTEVTEAEMEQYYKGNPQIRASHILLRLPPNADEKKEAEIKKKIDDIYQQVLKDKKAFPELAKKYSEDPSAKRGGDLDYFSKDRMVEPFSSTAFGLKNVGDISQPIKTRFGWHIIQLTGIKAFKDADKNQLRQELLNQKRQKIVEDYFAELAKRHKVTLYPKRLEELKIASPPPAPVPVPTP